MTLDEVLTSLFPKGHSITRSGGLLTGHALFGRLDPVRFRRVVFALLLLSGLVLLIRG